MEVGAIGYHDRSKVRKIRVTKDNSIVNRINRTKEESFPNLAELQEARAAEYRAEQKEIRRQQLKKEKAEKLEREEQVKLRSFDSMMDQSKMVSNAEITGSVDARYGKSCHLIIVFIDVFFLLFCFLALPMILKRILCNICIRLFCTKIKDIAIL